MPRQINIPKAIEGFTDGKDGHEFFDYSHIKSYFVKLLADYNSGRIESPHGIDLQQVEDWLLGRAVCNMLAERRHRMVQIGEENA